MDFDHRDREGYIRPEADLANVQAEYQGVPTAAAGLLAGEFRSRLHSAYLYGSVARGNAVPGRSDIDLLAVLLAAPVDEDRGRAERVERALVERFPVLFSAGVGLTHLQEVRSPAQRYGLQVFLRELAVCICGEDLRPGLPPTKPSAAVAAGFHDDTRAVFARARETLGTSTDPEVIRRVCRMASRRMVQVAFAVVMAREGYLGDGVGGAGRRGRRRVPAVGGGRGARRRPGAAARGRCQPCPGAAGQLRPLGRGRARPGGVGDEQPRRSSAVTRRPKNSAAPPTRRLPTRQVVVVGSPHPPAELVTITTRAEPTSTSPAVPQRALPTGSQRSFTDNHGHGPWPRSCRISPSGAVQGCFPSSR